MMSEHKAKILIVEDQEPIRRQLRWALHPEYQVLEAGGVDEAVRLFAEHRPGVVTLDLDLPSDPTSADEGFRVLQHLLALDPRVKVVVIGGNGDRGMALKAIELGAYDYYEKPIDIGDLRVMLRRALHVRRLEDENLRLQRMQEGTSRFGEILGRCQRMQEVFAVTERVADTTASVLITGERGTGKALIARTIHQRSRRADRLLVSINCGAIREAQLESDLFGHEEGAYGGAHGQRKGKLEVADGGTLFLDEIGEMSLPLQAKFLRFLQEREMERVGGRERIKVDVRVLAAGNKDLKAAIAAGRFREDLYYRLSVVTIRVPSLRDRGEDIPLLADAFLRRSCQELGRNLRFSKDALLRMTRYPWPGNIGELENAVHRAVIMAPGRLIEPSDLAIDPAPTAPLPTLKEARSRVEHQVLLDVLTRTRGNVSQAARQLGVSRPTFHELLYKFQVNAKEFR